MDICTLKDLLFYNPETGVFLHRKRRTGVPFAGMVAGSVNTTRGEHYYQICLQGKNWKAHRLAWLYVYGEFPKGDIDHINGDRLDNRISNLRDVTKSENCKNKTLRVDNKSGVSGVYWNKGGAKWHVQIAVNGKRKHLGFFSDLDEAIRVRREAEVKYGYHSNHGRLKTESSRQR